MITPTTWKNAYSGDAGGSAASDNQDFLAGSPYDLADDAFSPGPWIDLPNYNFLLALHLQISDPTGAITSIKMITQLQGAAYDRSIDNFYQSASETTLTVPGEGLWSFAPSSVTSVYAGSSRIRFGFKVGNAGVSTKFKALAFLRST